MRRVKRICNWLVCLLITLCMAGVIIEASAVCSVQADIQVGARLNKNTLTMYEGGSYKLELIGASEKIKWTSTNKKVAKVASDGTVTAVGKGKATIKATIKSGNSELTLKCKITVKKGNAKGIAVNSKNFPDKGFRSFVSNVFDDDGNGYISNEELGNMNVLDVKYMDDVKSLRGAHLFTNLKYVYCNDFQMNGLEKVPDDVWIIIYPTNTSKKKNYKLGEQIAFRMSDTFTVAKKYSITISDMYLTKNTAFVIMDVEFDGKSETLTIQVENGQLTNVSGYRKIDLPFTVNYCENDANDAIFTFTKRVYPKAMTLSGNPDDIYEITDYAYVVGENVDLFFDKGIKVSGDSLLIVEQVMSELEEKTGLKYKNNTIYSTLASDGWREAYFGFDPWDGYNRYSKEKISIYFVHDSEQKGWISVSAGNSLVLIDEDFDFHGESVNTLAHELAHSLDRANHENFYLVLTEGFGSYWGRQISLLHSEFISEEQWEYGPNLETYWSIYPGITSENAESLFNAKFDRIENPTYYEYGFQLMTYLYENYPVKKINKFYNELTSKLKEIRYQEEYAKDMEIMGFLGDYSSSAIETEALKAFFGEDFFEKFGTWAQKNVKRFLYS